MGQGAGRRRRLSEELHDAEARRIALLLLQQARRADAADGQLLHRPRVRAGGQGRAAAGLSRSASCSSRRWTAAPATSARRRRSARASPSTPRASTRSSPAEFLDAMSTPEMGKMWIETVYLQTGIKADVKQFTGPHAAYFTELMDRQKGAKYFIGQPRDMVTGAVQGRLRAGAELRLPRRPALGRSDRGGDEQGLLQGLAWHGRGTRAAAMPDAVRRSRHESATAMSAAPHAARCRRRPIARRAGLARSCSRFSRPRCWSTPASRSIRCCARSTTRSTRSGRRAWSSSSGSRNFTDAAVADPVFWKAVGNTALFTIVATIVDVVGGLLLALCLFARAPLAPLLRVVWFTPVLMSYVVVGIIWVWIYDYDWGLANAVLRWLGLGALRAILARRSRRRRCGRCWSRTSGSGSAST